MFAHGYEFDFNTPDCNWKKFSSALGQEMLECGVNLECVNMSMEVGMSNG